MLASGRPAAMDAAVLERVAARDSLQKHRGRKRPGGRMDKSFSDERQDLLDRRWTAGISVIQYAVRVTMIGVS